jgi:hypothetical protein
MPKSAPEIHGDEKGFKEKEAECVYETKTPEERQVALVAALQVDPGIQGFSIRSLHVSGVVVRPITSG